MRSAETIIIGGGVVGSSVAYHLTERGANDVLILESEAVQGLGSTGAATGGVRAQFETDINIKMSLYSLDFLRNWEYDCEYDPAGYLFFATTAEQLAYLQQNVIKQREFGVTDVEIVSAEDVKRLVPFLNCEDIAGGSFGKHDGFINPLAVMNGFADSAFRNGANIEYSTQVLSLKTDGQKITAVETNRGTIECENVVLCTGAWAKQLAATAGIELPVEPQRRQIVWAKSSEPLPANMPMVIDIGSGFHFRPAKTWNAGIPPLKTENILQSTTTKNHEVLFAFPDPDEPCSVNRSFDEGFIDKVYQRAKHRAPYLSETEIVREKCRAGLYENTPDHHAILGGCDVKGLYFANGFSGHGVMHSPATGRALAETILDGKVSFLDVSCLSLNRFSTGKLLHETAFI